MIGLGLSLVGGSAVQASSQGNRNVPLFSNTKSLNFDGTNDYAEFASDSVLPGLIGDGDFAISYWVKAADFTTSGSGGVNYFIYSLLFAGGPFNYFVLGSIFGNSASSAGKMVFQIATGSTNYITTTSDSSVAGNMTNNDWNHVVFSCRDGGSSRIGTLYINGSLVASTSTSNSGADFGSGSFGDLRIGSTTINIASNSYQAIEIDEFSVYNATLTGSNVTDIYNSGVPADESSRSNLVGYWRMEDNGDDSSSNSNALTISGATFTTDVPS